MFIFILCFTGDKPYKCDYCDKSFARAQNLKDHTNRHLANPNLTICPYCQKGFPDQEAYSKHVKKSHSSIVNAEGETHTVIVTSEDTHTVIVSGEEARAVAGIKQEHFVTVNPQDIVTSEHGQVLHSYN